MEVPGGWPGVSWVPCLRRSLLSDAISLHVLYNSSPLGGDVREIDRSGPVVQLVHVDAKAPPACHVLAYLSDSRQFANPYPGIGRGTLQHLIIEVATLDSTHTKVKNISQHSYKM